jgi:hypothetical protein
MLQLWPTQQMTFEAKLNAISRLIIVISILGFLFTRNFNLLIIGIITLAIIFTLYRLRKQKLVSSFVKKEGFSLNSLTNDSVTTNPITMESLLRSNFHPTTKKNPFGNVLLTDINDTPNRLAAAPSFNPDVYEDIMNATKKQTQMLNPGIINTNKQLFGDLYENYVMDNSMMRFYSTANSRIASDQGAFSQYLYGNMPSSKESNAEGAMQRVKNAERYLLI